MNVTLTATITLNGQQTTRISNVTLRSPALVNTMTGLPNVFTPAAQRNFALGVNFRDAPYTDRSVS